MPSTVTYHFNAAEPLFVSRFRRSKREAVRDANWMKRHGGKYVKITGKRGVPWRVRGKMGVGDFAHFRAIESAREARES